MLAAVVLVCALATGADASCTPAPLQLGVGSVMVTSTDKYYQPGDIFARNCSALPQRQYIGWCPDPHDVKPKLQINLPGTTAVHGLVFQTTLSRCMPTGHNFGAEAFLETFDLQYVLPGDNLRTLMTYSEDMPALDGLSFEKTLKFDPPLVTPILSLTPKSHNLYPCFRIAVLGCSADNLCQPGFCQNGGSCAGKDYCACPQGFIGNSCNMTAKDIEQQNYSFMEIKNNTLITPDADFKVVGDVTLSQNRRRDGHGHHGHSCHFHGHGHHHGYCEYSHGHSHGHSNNHNNNNHHDNGHHCMHGLTNNHPGFTTSMNVHYGENHHGHHYLFSNGGNLQGHHGSCLSYDKSTQKLIFIVSTITHKWTVNANVNLGTGTTNNIATSWHPQTGAQLYVNNKNIGSCGKPQPHAHPHNSSVQLRLGDGHVTLNINININLNFSISGLNMYPAPATALAKSGVQGPYTPAPPTSIPQPVTATTTHRPFTTTPQPVTATTTHQPTPSTTLDHRPVCYNYANQTSTSASTNHVRCQTDEVCTLFQDKRMMYTAKCLEKSLCEAGKRLAAGTCWECCDSYLCNDQCSSSTSGQCADKTQCVVLMSTGYDVCSDQKLAVDICSKTCKIC